jgi:5'(3')-deoxyribonucleotidase
MRIAIDLDSTLSKFQEAWVDKYNLYYHDTVECDSILSWNIQDYCTKCTPYELYNLLEDDFFLYVEVQPDAKEVVDLLRVAGHELFIVTAYSSEACVNKSVWLKDHFNFNQSDIIFCNDKSRIQADMLIDDGLHNHENFGGRSLLFTQSHNKSDTKYERVNDWLEIKRLLLK